MTRSKSGEQQVFAAANFARVGSIEGRQVRQPASLVHAKTMGTNATLCGLITTTWFKFYDQPFEGASGEKCRTCLEAYARAWSQSLDV
jgi:hypothetical protein